MKQKSIIAACKIHSYILLRDKDGNLFGLNCKVGILGAKFPGFMPESESWIKSFIPCSFQEYINYKIPFIKK
jgi:hypothetical protein